MFVKSRTLERFGSAKPKSKPNNLTVLDNLATDAVNGETGLLFTR